MASGKSPDNGSGEPTPCTTTSVANLLDVVFHSLFGIQTRRRHGSGQGTKDSADPRIREAGEVGEAAPELRGPPTPERKHPDSKTRTSSTATSTPPPAEHLPRPTLCTSLETWFPRPPAAGAAGGGRGNPVSPASKVA